MNCFRHTYEPCGTCTSDDDCPDKLSRDVSAIAPRRKNPRVFLLCSADWVNRVFLRSSQASYECPNRYSG